MSLVDVWELKWKQRKMTETRSQNFTAIYRSFAVEFVNVCRY